MPEEVVLVSGVRMVVGKFGRAFRDIPAQQLGATVIREAVNRVCIQMNEVEKAIMDNVILAGLGQNPARQASLYAGLPPEIGSFTVNKVIRSLRWGKKFGDAKLLTIGEGLLIF